MTTRGPRAALAIAALGLLAACGEREAARAPEPLPPPADALEATIRERAAVDAERMVPSSDVFRGELAAGERRDHTAIMRRGACYKVLGAGGAGVTDLDILVYDDANVLLQRDGTGSATPVIGRERAICPQDESGAYRVEVRMAEGAGAYAVQAWSSH